MLRAGFFESFKGADTLLIWGDEQGLVLLQQFMAQRANGTSMSGEFGEIEGVQVRPRLKVTFELGSDELRIDRNDATVVIVASCSADLLSAFAAKIARLAGPKRRTGHQYLEWPGGASIVIMVSKGEYPDDFGA